MLTDEDRILFAGRPPIDWLYENLHRFVFHPSHFIDAAQLRDTVDAPNDAGVYFLINGAEIKYIGMSVNLSQRLNIHYYTKRFTNRDFEKVALLTGIPGLLVHYVENFYIHWLQPAWNDKYAPFGDPSQRMMKIAKERFPDVEPYPQEIVYIRPAR